MAGKQNLNKLEIVLRRMARYILYLYTRGPVREFSHGRGLAGLAHLGLIGAGRPGGGAAGGGLAGLSPDQRGGGRGGELIRGGPGRLGEGTTGD